MPRFQRILDSFSRKETAPVNTFEGFTARGEIVLRDRRGTRKAEIPSVDLKGETLGSDALAIYKPSGTKSVDPAKAMGQFNNWSYAAVNAIARDVSNIQLRLYQVKGTEHEEVDDHPLLTLLEGVNETMTGVEFKYVLAAHLELTGNFFAYLDGSTGPTSQPRALHPLNPGSVRIKLVKGLFPPKIS